MATRPNRPPAAGAAAAAILVLLCHGCANDAQDKSPQADSPPDASTARPVEPSTDASADAVDASIPDWEPPEGLGHEGPIAGLITDPNDAAAYIYDPREVRTYELRLSERDLATLDADPRAEQYVEGSLLFEGKEHGPVGIRYKGSVGAFRGCTASSRSGAKTCRKLSIKVKFNWNDPDAAFYGLRKLQFHSMKNDPSRMKERLGYAVYRRFGVPAPRVAHARLRINGELSGLYALVEHIDGRFTRSRFVEGGKGNLYKELWPLDSAGEPPDTMSLMEQLRTNEDEDPSFDRLLTFSGALRGASQDELSQVIERFTDVEHGLRYLAVDRAIANDDGIMHWYCGGRTCWNHNFFWYEEPDAARLWLIPWDLDLAFNIDNRTTTIWYDWDDTGLGCLPVWHPPFNVPQRPASCDKLSLGWAGYQERYLALLEELLAGPLDPSGLEQQLLEWEAQVWPYIVEEAGVHDDAIQPDEWQQGRAWLRASIERLRERTEARIDAGPRLPGDPFSAAAQ